MRTIVLVLLLLCAHVAPAASAGINLSWDVCGSLGAASRFFACDTNAGEHTLVGSFVVPAGIDSLNGNSMVVDIRSSCPTLPDWWRIQAAGSCRQDGAIASFDFTTDPLNCYDYWKGRAFGGFRYAAGYGGVYSARLLLAAAIHTAEAGPVAEGTEVYSFKFEINNTKTVGVGACEGCQAGTCIVLNSIKLTQNPGSAAGTRFLGNPADRNYVTWQFVAQPDVMSVCVGGSCPVPAKQRTWGQLKSLYR